MRKISGNKVRFGIVGVGVMGRHHARAIVDDRSGDFMLGAVADFFEGPARSAGEEFGVPWFTDPDKMFNSGLVDAVLIVTPHYWHPVQTIQAARAGLHVLCEKPLAVTIGPARQMIDECRKADVALGAMLQARTRGCMKKMKEIISSGQLGQIHHVTMVVTNWYRTQAYYDSGAWRGTWDGEGGGILLNQAPHHLDIFQWLFGVPKRITAFLNTRLHRLEVENTADVVCEFGNGHMGYIRATTAQVPGEEKYIVNGDRGSLVCENGAVRIALLDKPISEDIFANPETRADFIPAPKFQWADVPVPKGGGDRLDVIRAFAGHILRGEPMVAPGDEAFNELEMSNAMYLSGYGGNKPVDLPVDAQKIARLVVKMERDRSTGRGHGQRQKSERALKKLMRQQ